MIPQVCQLRVHMGLQRFLAANSAADAEILGLGVVPSSIYPAFWFQPEDW